MTQPVLGLTGATGFVGQVVLAQALAQGWFVRALTRSSQPPRDGVKWVIGALDQAEALADMAQGCDAIIHVAGVVNAPDLSGFETGNVAGTMAVIAAARAAHVDRFIHVSSLAAREPQLSHYGASKAKAELIVQASGLDWTMVRPPSVYGPGDRDNLELFTMAKRGFVPLPPPGRLSLIHVDDLARLLLAVITVEETRAKLYEPDDGVADGWTHRAFAKAIGWALGKNIHALSLPRTALYAGARVDRLFRGKRARLTRDRVNYFCHPDWVADPARAVPPQMWVPMIKTRDGLKATAAAYRAAGWL
ncbi:MAG: NAD-dependent epimerase/dehydratase family protein [Sphingomonadaceae bacterium]